MRTMSGCRLWFGAAALITTAVAHGRADLRLPNAVASGEVTTSTALLWANTTTPGDVLFEYGTDPTFRTLLGASTVPATDGLSPVRLELSGLAPGTRYHYRATDDAGAHATGTFRTPAAPNERAGLRFGVSGDWRGELAPYPSVRNAMDHDLDFFVGLGDTIYADVESPILPGVTQAQTEEEFRLKHLEVYTERFGLNTLSDLRAAAAWWSTIDDHEVTNDFAGGAPPASDPRFASFPGEYINETAFFANGLAAFQAFHPVRDVFYGATGDPRTAGKRKLYRTQTYGRDAAIVMLDARSFRDEPLPDVQDPTNEAEVLAYLAAAFTPGRTMLGPAQVDELLADLAAAQAAGVTWKFVMVPEPIQNLGVVAASDRFEGYAAERSMILDFIVQRGITNVVFIAADIHGTFVNNLTYQLNPRGPQLPTGAFEVTTGSVAYWAPFGQTVMGLLFRLGFLPPSQYEAYLALPQVLKDGFVQNIMNALLVGLGYDPLGLAGSEIDAALLDGAYTIVHTFGWTAFEIDASTAALTVSTYGIAPYGADDLLADPDAVTARVPALLGRFRVMPTGVGCPGDVSGSGDVGADDLAVLLAAWGPNRGHAADFNGDGEVGPSDLAILLGQWGPCPG